MSPGASSAAVGGAGTAAVDWGLKMLSTMFAEAERDVKPSAPPTSMTAPPTGRLNEPKAMAREGERA